MRLFVCVFLGLMVCACLVSVQAGLRDMFGHDEDDEDQQKKKDDKKDDKKEEKGYHSHYQGGIGKQVVHTLVDGAVDRLGDMAEVKLDNPLMHAAIVGGGKKLKNKLHDEVNEFGNNKEEVKEGRKSENRKRFGLFRR